MHPNTPALDVSVITDDTIDLLGKDASDLMDGVAISNGKATGTLKYVTGYTGFSGDVSEQSGNYIALLAESDSGATITAEVVGGVHGAVTLDSDGILIARLTENATGIKYVVTKGTDSKTVVIDTTDLTLAES